MTAATRSWKRTGIRRCALPDPSMASASAAQIAEASGSVYEVMAYLSHGNPKTAAIDTKRVDRAKLAERAFVRAEAAAEARSVPRAENRGALGTAEPSKIKKK